MCSITIPMIEVDEEMDQKDDYYAKKKVKTRKIKEAQAIVDKWRGPDDEDYVTIKKDDLVMLLHFLPAWVKEVPEGLNPMFYGSLSYEKDLAIKKRIDALVEKLL